MLRASAQLADGDEVALLQGNDQLAPPASAGEATSLPAVDDVSTNALPPPTYQWYRDRFLVPGANNAGLDLPAPNPLDAGLYYVVITTPLGIITNYVAAVEV